MPTSLVLPERVRRTAEPNRADDGQNDKGRRQPDSRMLVMRTGARQLSVRQITSWVSTSARRPFVVLVVGVGRRVRRVMSVVPRAAAVGREARSAWAATWSSARAAMFMLCRRSDT